VIEPKISTYVIFSYSIQDTYIIKYFTVYFNKINKFIQRKDYFQWVNNNGKDIGNACIKTKIGQTNIQRIAVLLIVKSLTAKPVPKAYAKHTTQALKPFYMGL